MNWSVSAYRMWSRCQRQFFIDQFMAHPTAKDPMRQRAQFLGGVQQLAWWPGRVVHSAIQSWVLPSVRDGRWPDARIITQAQDLARRQFFFSKEGHYLHRKKSEAGDEYCVLAPHYFGQSSDSSILDKALATVTAALQHLLSSPLMRDFLTGRQWYRWEHFLEFEMDGKRVRAVPDVLLPSKAGPGLEVVDWKVATSSSRYHFQVAVYALAARATAWLADRANAGIAGYVINLVEDEPGLALEFPYEVDEGVLANTENEIFESFERIYAAVGDKKYDQLDIEQFMYATSAGTCALCNWRELCVELSHESRSKSLPDLKSRPTQLGLPLG